MSATRILIVEDEALIADELQERLARLGFVVTGVLASGEATIAHCERDPPDLTLLDIRLKGTLDGIDTATVLRDRFGVPTVFLTAHSDAPTLARAKAADPLGYVLKPYTEKDLLVTVEIAVHRHAADRLTRRLLETQKLESLGRLAGGVVHDFGNLLVPIIGHASLAAMEAPPDSPLATRLNRITQAAERASDLCRQMLAYCGNRVESTPLDVNATILQIQELLRVAATKQGILTFDLADDLGDIDGDPAQIQHLLMNLVLNSAEALDGGDGTIVVHTARVPLRGVATADEGDAIASDAVLIEVIDTGHGMDDETQERAFEPFFTTRRLGRGLGLSAAQGIVRAHFGSMTVHSRPGAGCTVRVTLPARGTHARAPQS